MSRLDRPSDEWTEAERLAHSILGSIGLTQTAFPDRDKVFDSVCGKSSELTRLREQLKDASEQRNRMEEHRREACKAGESLREENEKLREELEHAVSTGSLVAQYNLNLLTTLEKARDLLREGEPLLDRIELPETSTNSSNLDAFTWRLERVFQYLDAALGGGGEE